MAYITDPCNVKSPSPRANSISHDDNAPEGMRGTGGIHHLTDVDDLRRQFQAIATQVAEVGLPVDALTSLESFAALVNSLRSATVTLSSVDGSPVDGASPSIASQDRGARRRGCPRRISALAVASLIIATASSLMVFGSRSTDPFRFLVALWLHSEEADVDGCLLSTDSPVADLFRPPVDCARVCHDVVDVDRIAYEQLSREEFETRYAYTGRPVIVSGAMVNWSAPQTFNFEYFRKLYAEKRSTITKGRRKTSSEKEEGEAEDNCQFFAWGANEFASLHEVLQMDADRAAMKNGTKPWYFGWSNCDTMVARTLRSQYSRPAFLPETSESSTTDWIFMGSPGFGAPLHVDNVGNPSWQAQVIGSKIWILEPPSECYMECVDRLEVTVNSGEIIVLDTNQWYHSTMVVGSQISITIGSEYD